MDKKQYMQPEIALVSIPSPLMESVVISGYVDDPGSAEGKSTGEDDGQEDNIWNTNIKLWD